MINKDKSEGWQFFSKWRNAWIDFDLPPGKEELKDYKKYHYAIRQNPVKSNLPNEKAVRTTNKANSPD
jgi:hypothetical protein